MADWALYEATKSVLIPNYSGVAQPNTKSILSTSDKSELEIAARYALSSSTAMSLAAVLTNPIEVAKTRWQTSGRTTLDSSLKEMTVRSMVRDIWRQGGWRAFVRGAGMRVLYYVCF